MVKKILGIILVLSIIFITSCSAMTGYITKKEEKSSPSSDTVVLEVNGQNITHGDFDKNKKMLLIHQKIIQNNIELLNQNIKAEKDEVKIASYKRQLALEKQKLIDKLDNGIVAQEIITNIILYEEAIRRGQAIGPNKAKAIAQEVMVQYQEQHSKTKGKTLKSILKDLDIEEQDYWEELEPLNIMYKNSINNLKIELAREYIEANFKEGQTKPSYGVILQDKAFINYFNSYKDTLIKNGAVKIRKGYI